MKKLYEMDHERRKTYYEENYMSVVDPVTNVKMSVTKDFGQMMLKLGWEIPKKSPPIGYKYTVDENEEDAYYDDSIGDNVTEHVSESFATVLPSDLITEMSTDGTITDMATEVISDLMSNSNSTVSIWDGLMSNGAHVASLIGEKVANSSMNLTEEIIRINTTEGDHEDSPLSFKKFQDFHPAFLPGPVQVSLLLLVASGLMLLTSK